MLAATGEPPTLRKAAREAQRQTIHGQAMNKLHIAISTAKLEDTVTDYSKRLGAKPCVIVEAEYALWRTETLNLSVRQDPSCKPGELRHLGWEDPAAQAFCSDTDVNGVTWERFTAQQQADEINAIWPGTDYQPA
ncbi:VOC family protein [Vulcanococcus limneticus]|uniref:hypothetical protein n=1 Tax=Vulcanococcus limneticus TaxID=2170428 RepID=UPI001E49156A|nr:hypothetical protein [Vulcanococcus limneticus]